MIIKYVIIFVGSRNEVTVQKEKKLEVEKYKKKIVIEKNEEIQGKPIKRKIKPKQDPDFVYGKF